ncbi:hypothetical protein NLG97_g5063 [Lecanicillium saksenae]|uniref:Uncharacterized protein n=1 Tax=Lecanicillium saksenae TaxID=468837 RepID=A0ACC1QWR4_9HYPO|nr:hypothetical protein NLG97_g5063 [Lecanicillium saksenae]
MWLAAFLAGFYAVPVAAANVTHSTVLYKQFFPAWDGMLKDYLETDCKKNFTNYLNVSFEDTHVSYSVLDCLLKQFPEFRKAELGAAAVVLGLAPTILQMISPTPADTALISVRRPILALLLGMASPASVFSPATSYAESLETLSKPLSRQLRASFPYTTARLLGGSRRARHGYITGSLSVLQYVLALAAVANSAYRTYQLCVWTVCSFSPITVFLPALWHGTVVLVHLGGWIALRLNSQSAKITKGAREEPHWQSMATGWQCRLKALLFNETMPSALAKRLPINSREAGPAPFFSVVTSALYVGVPVHVLFGTLVLSSLMFISAFDSIAVVAWYALSTIVANAIVYFEYAGIQAAASEDLENTAEGQQMIEYSAL